jgi:hypothetical protein
MDDEKIWTRGKWELNLNQEDEVKINSTLNN